eukprot:gene4261-5011_t
MFMKCRADRYRQRPCEFKAPQNSCRKPKNRVRSRGACRGGERGEHSTGASREHTAQRHRRSRRAAQRRRKSAVKRLKKGAAKRQRARGLRSPSAEGAAPPTMMVGVHGPTAVRCMRKATGGSPAA